MFLSTYKKLQTIQVCDQFPPSNSLASAFTAALCHFRALKWCNNALARNYTHTMNWSRTSSNRQCVLNKNIQYCVYHTVLIIIIYIYTLHRTPNNLIPVVTANMLSDWLKKYSYHIKNVPYFIIRLTLKTLQTPDYVTFEIDTCLCHFFKLMTIFIYNY